MQIFVAAGAGFLLAVLLFDLMFDVQIRGHRDATIPEDVLDSISTYYRRVTTDARPMNLAVALVMLLTLGAIADEIVAGPVAWPVAWVSFAALASAVVLARIRTLPDAKRLGARTDNQPERTRLARRIYADHLYCLAAIALVEALHLAA